MVQIHLAQNRTNLALKEVQAARRWAQDSLLVNLAESWVGLRVVSLPLQPLLLSLVSTRTLQTSSPGGRRTAALSLSPLSHSLPSHSLDRSDRFLFAAAKSLVSGYIRTVKNAPNFKTLRSRLWPHPHPRPSPAVRTPTHSPP